MKVLSWIKPTQRSLLVPLVLKPEYSATKGSNSVKFKGLPCPLPAPILTTGGSAKEQVIPKKINNKVEKQFFLTFIDFNLKRVFLIL